MIKPTLLFAFTTLSVALLSAMSATPARADDDAVFAPARGVVCDRYVCADEKGISFGLTESYLGNEAQNRLLSQGDFDLTEFTFTNGIFCDVKERVCREDRYYGADGRPSGAVSEKYTAMLFG
ncbi:MULTISPECIES: YcgJ family protein [unclassified Mycolicibacterium]|uniref:YcgJ family protein n=1 Tax=unclassified Mycolicibacterium TaxID=2636767 RepID=UPI00192E3457|nr:MULTISPECIES: YcgJ family protein [unclassified Mycolicibacterium]